MRTSHRVALGAAAMLAVSAVGASIGGAAGAQPVTSIPAVGTLKVATTGADTGTCQSSPCASLGYALSKAVAGNTILVEPGTYQVTADPSGTSNTVPATLTGLTVESDSSNGGGATNTIFNVTGAVYGLLVNADETTVNGLTFENAGAAGIQVSPPSTAKAPIDITGALIENNVIDNSDQCANTPKTAACTAAIGAGDYGESLWLMSATQSTVKGNTIENGLDGGMLVSDEMGPNYDNTIEGNNLQKNALGCGITLAAHNTSAIMIGPGGKPEPNPVGGGVYDDTVMDNTSDGAGANGIALFNFAYNNTVEGNTTVGNGGPGIEIDDDIPPGDLNGNSVIGNTVGVNSLMGGPDGDSPGQHTVHTTQTAGILVIANGAAPVSGTVIKTNTITGNYYGIWMGAKTIDTTVSGNTISVSPGGRDIYTAPEAGTGYWLAGRGGGVLSYGAAPFEGSAGGGLLGRAVVGLARTPDDGGYWLVNAAGTVRAYGDAINYGSVTGKSKSAIVAIAGAPDGGGYWLVNSTGQVFPVGDTKSLGSHSGRLDQPITGMTLTPDNTGYWMVAGDGGVFSYGDAKFHGSAANRHLSGPAVGIAATGDGGGYWVVTATGQVVAFGDAKAFGSVTGSAGSRVVGITATPDGGGYWLVTAGGGVLNFGDAASYGSAAGTPLGAPIVGLVWA